MLCSSKPKEMILDELLAEGLAPIGYSGWRMCLLLPPVCVLEAKPSAITRWRGKVRNVVKVFIAIMFLVSSLEEVWLPKSAPLLVSLSSCLVPLLLPVQQPLLGLFLLPLLFMLLGAPKQYSPDCHDKYVHIDQGGELYHNPQVCKLFQDFGYKFALPVPTPPIRMDQ
jgi:hypothetical protein